MKPTVQSNGAARRKGAPTPRVPVAPVSEPAQARPGPHRNALRHGLRSGCVLLPGDNADAFRHLRARLFRLHRPRTIEEAQCVETLVAGHWRIARCRAEQALFKDHLGAVLSGDPDAGGYLGSPDPHGLHHRGTDCGLEEMRLEKSILRARATLRALQLTRAQNLALEKSDLLEDTESLLAEGEPVVEPVHETQSEEPAEAQGTAASGPRPASAKSGAKYRNHGGNRNFSKRRGAHPEAIRRKTLGTRPDTVSGAGGNAGSPHNGAGR